MKLIYFVLFSIFIRPLSYLPLSVLYILAKPFYFIVRYVLRYRAGIIDKNLNLAFPTLNSIEKEKIKTNYYRFLADVMAENVRGLSISDKELESRVSYKNVALLEKYHQLNRNVTILTGHNCNFEWMLMTINKFLPQTVYSFYVEITNPYFRKLILGNRTRNGLQLLQAKDASAFYHDESIQNFVNIFASDQSPSNLKKAQWTQFLNQETAFVMGADKYSRQKNSAIVYMYAVRTKRGHYEINFKDISSDIAEMSAEQLLHSYVQALEETIKAQPECWLWSHNRWKRKREA